MNVWKYVGWYALAYFVAVVVVGVVASLLDGATASVGMIVPVIATFGPIGRFVTDFRRVPTPTERRTLFGACVGLFVVLQVLIVAVAAVAYPETARDIMAEPGSVIVILLLGIGIPIGFMWVAFRFMPARSLKNIRKAEARRNARRG
ncbi:ABZJ_00895 family protein [Gordonia sp. MP11Mi]|uniref:Uncharacterized protein n=1 Tax=Gordonia sp. MP11Mi TaxID=3022769 RepID=A0AA97CU93_9ACTN